MTDVVWDYESDFVNIDVDKDTEDGEPMFNIYFNFPMSLNLTKEQAINLNEALTTCLSKISKPLSDRSDIVQTN